VEPGKRFNQVIVVSFHALTLKVSSRRRVAHLFAIPLLAAPATASSVHDACSAAAAARVDGHAGLQVVTLPSLHWLVISDIRERYERKTRAKVMREKTRAKACCRKNCCFIQSASRPFPEIPMHSAHIRLHYQPKPDRVPRWMRRFWSWC